MIPQTYMLILPLLLQTVSCFNDNTPSLNVLMVIGEVVAFILSSYILWKLYQQAWRGASTESGQCSASRESTRRIGVEGRQAGDLVLNPRCFIDVHEDDELTLPYHTIQGEEYNRCEICIGESTKCPSCCVPVVRHRESSNQQEKEDDLCIICSDHSKDAVLLNCGHSELCLQCAYQCIENINSNPEGPTCPMCRHSIVGVVRKKKQTSI